jgi:gamma-tubulin complex component 3
VDVLDSVVADACTQVDHHLMEVITTRFHFARHCDVLRRYLLLGQGDYVQALLELVGGMLGIMAAWQHVSFSCGSNIM